MGHCQWVKFTLLVGVMACNRASSPETVTNQIVAIRDASVGSESLRIDNALVTYVIDDQPPSQRVPNGFFLQADPNGAGLFVPQVLGQEFSSPEVGDVVALHVATVNDTNTFHANLLNEDVEAATSTGIDELSVLVEDALAYQLAYDLDGHQSPPLSGKQLQNRIVSGSLLITTRMKPMGNGYLAAKVKMARQGISDPVHLLVSTLLANATHIQRGCQLRAEGVPVLKGPEGYYLLATRESEITIAVCDNPIQGQVDLSDSAPTSAGDVVFTELMTHSKENRGKDGEWFELTNTTEKTINLRGCQLRRPKPHSPHVIAEEVVLKPGQYAIFANSERPRGIYPDYVYYGGFGLLDDTGRTQAAITCGETAIDVIDVAVQRISGRSLTLMPHVVTSKANDSLRNWCWAPKPNATTSTNSDWSSPKSPNKPCISTE